MTPADLTHVQNMARQLRADVIHMSHTSGGAHLGSSLSSADILAVLYGGVLRVDPANPLYPERDRFILSKGHAAAVLYAALAYRGFISRSELEQYGQQESWLAEHPLAGAGHGIEAATGSLGHGLPIGVGMALSGRILGSKYRVFVLTSDGEVNEGSVWEAAMFAAAQKLDGLCVIVDYNKWQATGRTNEVLAVAPLADKWRSFGWHTIEVDGHSGEELLSAFREFDETRERPTAIVAHTVKGNGVSFMADDNNWHYRTPDSSEVVAAMKELGLG